MQKLTDVLATITLLAICLLTGAAAAQQRRAEDSQMLTSKKVLIVYLSRTKNTETVANMIHEKVGGDLVALELQTPYPEDYHATVKQVVREN